MSGQFHSIADSLSAKSSGIPAIGIKLGPIIYLDDIGKVAGNRMASFGRPT